MATNAITGYGTQFQKWDSISMDYDVIAEVTSISWEGASRNTIEVALLDPDDDYINKIQGLINPGTLNIALNYTKAGYLVMKTDFEERGDKTYRILLPDNAALEFDGYIGSLPLNFAPDAVLDGEITVEINGKVDYISAVTP